MSAADVDNLQVVIGGHTIIAGGILSTTASASCPVTLGENALVSSGGWVGTLNIDGNVSYSALIDSQTFPLVGPGGPDGTISVNNIASSTATSTGGDIVINALQINTTSGDQIVVASSHAGVTCPKATSDGGGSGGCPGKVTGGGVFMLNGKRQTFGFIAGTKNDGTAFGNFNYVNHGNGVHLQGTIQSVNIDASGTPSTATVTGALTENGSPSGSYTLVVTDAGQPGRADTFNLTSGPLTTGNPIALSPRGGNILIHKGCGVGPK
jgi:hypothetical protein